MLQYKCVNKQTTLSPCPKGFQSPKFSDSDFREVRGLGRPKSSDKMPRLIGQPMANLQETDY
jgi:hypothetical protein